MKIIKITAMTLAVLGAGFSQVSTASEIGDVVQLGCTLPGPVNPGTGFTSTVYSLEAVNKSGSIIADFPGITYGTSCTKGVNSILPRVTGGAGALAVVGNCGPQIALNTFRGVWQQANSSGTQALPNTATGAGKLVAGAVPVLLAPPTGGYALQQFTFVCVDLIQGGLPNNP